MSHALDYRNPRAAAADLVGRALMDRESARVWLATGQVMAGVAVTAACGWLVTRIAAEAFARMGVEPAWPRVVDVAVFAGSIALLVWVERRTRGDFFTDHARAWDTADSAGVFGPRTSSQGEWELRSSALTWAAYGELLAFGPRQVVSAVAKLRAYRAATPDVRSHAALIVTHLLGFADGQPVASLPSMDDQARGAAALRYLAAFDWVGVARDGGRVWLTSASRRHLAGVPSHGRGDA